MPPWASAGPRRPHPPPSVGVVIARSTLVDPDLADQVARRLRPDSVVPRCVLNRLAADPLCPAACGHGVIDFPSSGRYVAGAGYTGPVDVDIFNAEMGADATSPADHETGWLDRSALVGWGELARRLPQTHDCPPDLEYRTRPPGIAVLA